MTSNYWPAIEEVRRCIKTEAEELSDSTLIAVHEPMQLRRVAAGDSTSEVVDEWKLLEHVIDTNRPTPILGSSGFGKSHVIRWLDVQLNRRKPGNTWHIVRIPKNASLKQALASLLRDLDGQVFDDARKKIESVGRGLKTRTVAQHLVVFVAARLEDLYEEAEQQLNAMQEQGTEPAEEEVRRFKLIRRHAKRTGLPTLIADPYFSKQLVEEGKCFYQIAKRFTKGSNTQEIEENRFELEISDIEKNAQPKNLSLEAKDYVRTARISTSEDVQREVVALLNECLNDACREAFQQLFQFNSGSFQDLFQEIRKSLKDHGKKLFVLVEDMAAISAIEGVLIDSLMQEDVRDGQQVLCPLHSAIAVTTGYQGYARRQDTIKTRAKYEWHIDKQFGSEEETHQRIQDFCGRYLNAARYGEESLVGSFDLSCEDKTWPGIWKSTDKGEEGIADVFDFSPLGFPLFPFNPSALRALADRYCRPHETLEFNPRKILQHILREPLERFRPAYAEGEFPPDGFANVPCPGSLISDLELNVRTNRERAETLAAIWGYGAESIAELAHMMPAPIAEEFGLHDLSHVLEQTTPSARKSDPVPPAPPPKPAVKGDPKVSEPPEILDDDRFIIPRQVDEYFQNRSIPQNVARSVRKSLLDAIESGLKNYSDWLGLSRWPTLKVRNNPQIRIPFNPNNPERPILDFGSEAEFSDKNRARKYKKFVVAVLRSDEQSAKTGDQWGYPDGVQDYSNYENFLDEWVPASIEKLANLVKKSAVENIEERLKALSVFVPHVSNCTSVEKINYLVMPAEQIQRQVNTKTGIEEWDNTLARYLDDWDEKQKEWLDVFSTNRHGIEGDLIRKALHGKSDISTPVGAQRAAQSARTIFLQRFPSLKLLADCTTGEVYEETLTRLLDFIAKLRGSGQFKNVENMTAQKYINKIKKIKDSGNWKKVKPALALHQPFSAIETIKSLQDVDLNEASVLDECLGIWERYYETNLPRLKNENAEHGADKRKDVEDAFENLLREVGTNLEVDEGALL